MGGFLNAWVGKCLMRLEIDGVIQGLCNLNAPKHFGGKINVDAMCSTQKRSKWGGKDTINVTCVSHDANLLTVQENTERTLLFSYRCKARKTMCTQSERSTSVGTNNGSCMPTYVHWIFGNSVFTSEQQGYQSTHTQTEFNNNDHEV